MNLQQEKKDEMREDMLYEQRLRRDYDECVEHAMAALSVDETDIDKIKKLIDYINVYGWHVDFEDL